ncbi:hypothetical protein F5X99DRAFT_414100 [Biscogniauxia marginata]|nr:hypothetical protein F5X99DRAFT_414100 [Biscogniauxia marginata]
MGQRDQVATVKSDSGYGDDASETAPGSSDAHPLVAKGYEIGPASKLHVGEVFEFLWADVPEFEWEWKCLGYNRFIVLRHSDTFPHHCVCIPISTGGRHEFAKPGIDSFQQGFVFANGEPNPGYEQPGGGPRLPYSPVGIELRPGKFRVKEDSRANYADIIEVDHDAQVMVIGDVARYFDRVRRNVNKAYMRQILRRALEEYRAGKAGRAQQDGSVTGSDVAGDDDTVAAGYSPQDYDHYDNYDHVDTVHSLTDATTELSTVIEERPRREERRDPSPTKTDKEKRRSQVLRSKSAGSTSNPEFGIRSMPNVSMTNVALAGLK